MPPRGKASAKQRESEVAAASRAQQPASPPAPPPPPSTVNERSQQRFAESRPHDVARAKAGLSGLSTPEQTVWINSRFARSAPARSRLGNKALRDLWRHVNEGSLPVRTLGNNKCRWSSISGSGGSGTTASSAAARCHDWGRDKSGRDVGDYSIESFEARTDKRIALTALRVQSRAFEEKRDRAKRGFVDPLTGQPFVLCENEVAEEKKRRGEMASLQSDLYGKRTGSLAQDPEWDDVEPLPPKEPEGALAAIAYPDDYAEAISYLSAVIVKKEYSPRCLKLTDHVISLNPAHYSVWLYRASIIFALKIPIPDEIEWLNQVALEHLKNYQIWHHRHLLIDNYFPIIADSPEEVSKLAKSESAFLKIMLEEDTKNYHVWSYRSYLVRKLGMWTPEELASVEAMIDDDVRNNSAWSHRFFLVFSDPAAPSTPDLPATAPDPALPAALVDRELRFAQDKIRLAPQNQSPWNYLRGALAKGGRPLAGVETFVREFVSGLGSGEAEDVRSSHALDLLAEICAEKGDVTEAELCLSRLADQWDRIRSGYWEWRKQMIAEGGKEKA